MSDAHVSASEMAGLVMLDPSDPARRAAEAHLTECAECARQWRGAEVALGVLSRWELPPVSADRLEGVEARVLAAMRAEAPAQIPQSKVGFLPFASGALVFGVLVATARARNDAPDAWLGALLLLAVSLAAIAWGSRARDAKMGLLGALGLTIAPTALFGALADAGPVTIALGMKCTTFEVLGAGIPISLMLLPALRGKLESDPVRGAAVAAGGAAVVQAALHLSCTEHHSLHILAFHVGGVLLAAGLGGLSTRLANRFAH